MRNVTVYDLPTRLFHWLFATFFILSFVIAKTVDDESLVYSFHMLSGMILAGLVIWRIVWGLVGSKYAKFSEFNLNPLELKNYFVGIVSGSKQRWAGHNPASSWAAIVMFFLALGLGVTGYLMSTGGKETYEDIHEFLANTFIVVVIMHIAGVILHMIRHVDGIAFSMIDGKKAGVDSAGAIPSSRPFAAFVLMGMVVLVGGYLYSNFDTQTRTLSVFGQVLQLGENEDGGDGGEGADEADEHESGEKNSLKDDSDD